ncbi:MAG: rhomboid family intramembrane serine protease, partial [Myxococcota bacterium]
MFGSRSVAHRIAVGGQYRPLVGVDPWRLCTTVLLHVDLVHLGLNVAAVWSLGALLEPRIGGLRVVAWTALAGVAVAAASQLAG